MQQLTTEKEMAALVLAATSQEATNEKIIASASRACELLAAHQSQGERLKLSLGKILAIVQDSRAWEEEYKSFEKYRMAMAAQFGIGRSTISECLMIVRALPTLEADQAERIPATNLALVAKAMKDGAAPRKLVSLLREAETAPIAQFKARLQERGMLRRPPAREDGLMTVTLRVTNAVGAQWLKFLGDREPADAFADLLRISRSSGRVLRQAA
jgi:hypothetical protein